MAFEAGGAAGAASSSNLNCTPSEAEEGKLTVEAASVSGSVCDLPSADLGDMTEDQTED